jgi:hypothetical protein
MRSCRWVKTSPLGRITAYPWKCSAPDSPEVPFSEVTPDELA